MKKFFIRYSHWIALLIITYSFITTFIDFKSSTPDIIAVIMGGIGLIGIACLTFVVENRYRKIKKEK